MYLNNTKSVFQHKQKNIVKEVRKAGKAMVKSFPDWLINK